MTGLAPKSQDRVIAEIRANIVFETMVGSVLTAAAASGVLYFLIGIGARAASGQVSLGGAGAALFDAISFTFLFFLAGFAASLAIGIPLYRTLEKAKIRKLWPYVAAAFSVSLVILAIAGLLPSYEAPARLLFLAPGVGAALLFGRKMQRFWRAAAQADQTAPSVIRLH